MTKTKRTSEKNRGLSTSAKDGTTAWRVSCALELNRLNHRDRYELYGVVTHTGSTLEHGHYISYVKAPNDGDGLEPTCVIEARERVRVRNNQIYLAQTTMTWVHVDIILPF